MGLLRFEHIGIVVEDLAACIEFFAQLGLELQMKAPVEGKWVDEIVGLDGVRADIALMRTPDGRNCLELTQYNHPANRSGDAHASANTLGLRHISFAVTDIETVVAGLQARGHQLVGKLGQFEDIYRLCYLRGPEGIIVELAERIG